MSTADKLTTIAENVPKVYESGQENIKAQVEPLNAELEKCLVGTPAAGKTWYDKFWDDFQNEGKRTNYWGAFTEGFTDDNFKPKYPIAPTTCTYLFMYTKIMNVDVDLDLRDCGSITNVCSYTYNSVRSVKKMILKEDGSQNVSNAFDYAYGLEEIRIDGVVGKSGLNFQHSTKLSKESITSAINALSSITSGLTATFSKTAVQNAFGGVDSAEWTALIATKSNWTISLV